MKTAYRLLPALLLSALTIGLLTAGETGKLNGVVRDAETKEPLVGANVLLIGTGFGAATDVSGFYFVNNIPPGLYQVRVSMVGYQSVVYNDVRIMADVTTELIATVSSQAIELDREIVVIAQRPIVQRDLTSSRAIVEGRTIVRDLRLQSVGDVLQLQAGVTRGTDGSLHIRGGRTGGTVYEVDGIPLTNPFMRTLGGDLELENVQELQAHLGTFDAEYGNAADGVVTVYTRDGGNTLSGRITYESARLNSSPYQKKDWNLDRADVKSLPAAEQELYKDAVRKPDGTSAYDYVSVLDDPYAQPYLLVNALGTWTASLSGPLPIIPEVKFFATGRLRNEDSYLPWGYSLYRALSLKLTYPLSSLFTIRGSYDWSREVGQDYNHTYKYWRWFNTGLDQLGREGSYPIDRSFSDRQILSARHVLSTSTFYDLSLARIFDTSREVVPDRTVVYNKSTGDLISSDYFQRLYVGGSDSNFMYGDVRYWTRMHNTQFIFKGNLESQLDKHHQIRTGFELDHHDIFRHRIGMPPRSNVEFFEYRPLQAATYVQDKIEYSFMILKLGVRVDYFDPRASEYPDPAAILQIISSPTGSVDYQTIPKVAVKPHLQISPRIGLAHPISDKTSIHFAYGHFFQIPRFYDLYRNDALNDILANDALVGNPGLKPEKTVSFEVGLQQQLSTDWAIDVSAYSKDISNLTSTFYYFVGRDYTIFINNDFGRVQGIDVNLNKRFSDFYSTRLTYSLMYAQGNTSDPTEGYSSYREEDAHLRPNRNFPLDFDQRHKINATLIARLPKNFGPEAFGGHPLELFSVTAIFTAASGFPYTPTSRQAEESNIVPEPNSARRPWVFNLDLKVSREIQIDPVRVTAYVDVENVLDAVNTRLIWTRTGDPWDEGPTSVRPEDRQANPGNVYPPRSIRAGFFLEF